jgi:hypothetical protein
MNFLNKTIKTFILHLDKILVMHSLHPRHKLKLNYLAINCLLYDAVLLLWVCSINKCYVRNLYAINHSASPEIPSLLWKLKDHYCVHKSLPVAPVLSQMHPVHTFQPYFPKTHSNLNGLFLSCFPTKIFYEFLISPMHATYPIHLTLIDFITLILFGEACKLQNFIKCKKQNIETQCSILIHK